MPFTNRKPIVTAISATDSVAINSRASDDKNEIFSVYALEYLASEYEHSDFDTDYDRAYGYDVLYSEMN